MSECHPVAEGTNVASLLQDLRAKDAEVLARQLQPGPGHTWGVAWLCFCVLWLRWRRSWIWIFILMSVVFSVFWTGTVGLQNLLHSGMFSSGTVTCESVGAGTDADTGAGVGKDTGTDTGKIYRCR